MNKQAINAENFVIFGERILTRPRKSIVYETGQKQQPFTKLHP